MKIVVSVFLILYYFFFKFCAIISYHALDNYRYYLYENPVLAAVISWL